MIDRPIDAWWAGGIVCHQDNRPQLQLLDHSFQVSLLIIGRICIPTRLVRRTPPEKIKGHHSARREVRDETIIKMKVIWKAVHQNDRRLFTRILSDVNAVFTSRYELFCEIHLPQNTSRLSRDLTLQICPMPPSTLISTPVT